MRSIECAGGSATKGTFSKKFFRILWVFVFAAFSPASAQAELKIHDIIADLVRPLLYALDPGGTPEKKAALLVINAETEKVEKRIETSRAAWNMALSYADLQLYMPGGSRRLSVIDLVAQTALPDLQLPFDVTGVPGAGLGTVLCYNGRAK